MYTINGQLLKDGYEHCYTFNRQHFHKYYYEFL